VGEWGSSLHQSSRRAVPGRTDSWFGPRSWVRQVWRLLDPKVRHTQAVCRLRALVLASTTALAVSIIGSTGRAHTSEAAATVAGTSLTEVPAKSARRSIQRTTSTESATVSVAQDNRSIQSLLSQTATAPVITRIETTDPVVFVTIDDGTERSAEVADVLSELDMPVTLFLVDHPIDVGADYFASLPGALVESHTRTHPDLRTLSEADQRAEICGNADAITAAFGSRPRLFRPPYGYHNDAIGRAAADCGMSAVVLWNVVVEDGTISFRTVPRLRPGDIVLLHFTTGLPDDLRVLSERIRAAGLTVARLEDYLTLR
jgi:peptidoglycan/xylan/chitin deacetylase (PgdA/CDA1 family)